MATLSSPQILDRPAPPSEPKLAAKRERVSEALALLTPTERAVLLLNRRDGLSCDQIAELIGTSAAEARQAFVSGMLRCMRHMG